MLNLLPKISFNLETSILNSNSALSNGGVDAIQNSVLRYKKFLFLAKSFPNIPLVPTSDIDEVWHEHLLHPKFYFKDCANYFGYILNHNPVRDEKSKLKLEESFIKTSQLWNQLFNEEYNNRLLSSLCGVCNSDCDTDNGVDNGNGK